MPSPGGKVARRKPGRMRTGDITKFGMQLDKMVQAFRLYLF